MRAGIIANPLVLDPRSGLRTPLFAVEIRLVDHTEEALTTRISAIQQWLDDRGFEPSTFRYTFFDTGITLRVDFNRESEAVAFANEFSGARRMSRRHRAGIPTRKTDRASR